MLTQRNVEKALTTALRGPAGTWLRVDAHWFDIEPLRLERIGTRLLVHGRLAHKEVMYDDDSVAYLITLARGEAVSIDDVEADVDRDALRAACAVALDAVAGAGERWLDATATGSFDSTTAYMVGQEHAARALRRCLPLLDGSWAGEAGLLVANLAARLSLGSVAAAHGAFDPLGFAHRLSTTAPRVRPPRPPGPGRRPAPIVSQSLHATRARLAREHRERTGTG